MITPETRELAHRIWSYSACREPLRQADCIMVLGSHDARVARYAADLRLAGWAPWLLFSGGLSPFTARLFSKSEAEVFADVAAEAGVPREQMILESRSTNTGENFHFSRALFEERGHRFRSFIFVQKPSMLRRVRGTALKVWPDVDFLTTAPPFSFEEAVHGHSTEEMLVHEIVGDLQRVRLYSDRGFAVAQDIPPDVWDAYEKLVALGYTRRLAT